MSSLNNYIIRKLNKNDYDKYLILINQFRNTIFSKEQYENILNKIENNSSIWIIEYDNKIIATTTIIYEYKFIRNIVKLAHIEDVCVDENYRNKGIGNLLINHVVNEAEKEQCYKITLDCNEQLEKFYKKSGLKKRGIQMAKYLLLV